MVHTKTCLEMVPIVWRLVSLILGLPGRTTALASCSRLRPKVQPPARARHNSVGLTQRACESTASASLEAMPAPVPASGTVASSTTLS